MTEREIKISDLAPSAQLIARATSLSTALTLLDHWGGQKRYIPEWPDENSPITNIVGLTDARIIGEIMGAAELDVPNYPSISLKSRILAFPPGTATRDIARALRCSERRVRQVRQETETTPVRPSGEKKRAILAAPRTMSPADIAKQVGASPGYVMGVLGEAGMSKRIRRQPRPRDGMPRRGAYMIGFPTSAASPYTGERRR